MNIETFSALLPIKKHELDDELVQHSDVLFRISEQMTKLRELSASATDEFRKAEAEAFAAQKNMVDVGTGKGLSDTRAEMGARNDPYRNKSWTVMIGYKSELERWEALYEAWKSKGHNMKTLADLYATGNFSVGLGRPKYEERPAVARQRASRGGPG